MQRSDGRAGGSVAAAAGDGVAPALAPLRWGDNDRPQPLRSSCGPCPRRGDDADADVDTMREGDPT